MSWDLKYHNENLFDKQYKTLSPAAKKKLRRCLDALKTYGPNVNMFDNHQIEVDGFKYHTMDLSSSRRLVYSYDGVENLITVYDCGNHTLNGVKYCSEEDL